MWYLVLIPILLIIYIQYNSLDNKNLYELEVLPADIYQILLLECNKLSLFNEKNDIAPGRQRVFVTKDSDISKIINSKRMNKIVRDLVGNKVQSASELIPIEVRKYPLGSHMKWHRDELMHDSRQYECVLTIDNISDSITEYIDLFGVIHSIKTEPNSLMITRADGALHHVTPISYGSRTIIKFVYIKA